MKLPYGIAAVTLLALFFGCMFQPAVAATENETIKKEITEQFNQLAAAVNQKDAETWSRFYSKDQFLSAIAGVDYYDSRTSWVDAITKYFSMRERQQMQPLAVRVSSLAPGLALLTSEEKSEMRLKDGKNMKAKHVFTMIWKKGQDGWKILHSHESWIDEK